MKFPAGTHPLDNDLNRHAIGISGQSGHRIYIVGGYIRDALLPLKQAGKPKDIDYAVAGGSAVSLAHTIAAELGGHLVLLDEEFDAARVVLKEGNILDFTGCLGGDIKTDIMRRDFSINALFGILSSPTT